MRSSVVGTGVTDLPFQYSSTHDMMAPPEMNRFAHPAAHVVACRSRSSTIVTSQSAWLTSSSLPIVSYAFQPSICGDSEYASTPYSEMIIGFFEVVWNRWNRPMGEKYRRVYRFTPQKSRLVMYRSAILIHAAAPHICMPTRCCLETGKFTFASAVPHISPSSLTVAHSMLMVFISFSMELSN